MPLSPLQTLLKRAGTYFNQPPNLIARIPGRIDLLGSHTDYNDLPVLACALPMAIHTVAVESHKPTIHAVNLNPEYPAETIDLERPITAHEPGHWGNYIRAGVKGAIDFHAPSKPVSGWDALFHSSLPVGAGLSSSSAIVIAAALLTEAANNLKSTPAVRAEYLPDAEQFVGTQGGGLDHATILQSVEDHLLHIDFSPLRVQPTAFSTQASLAICHSGQQAVKSTNARFEYNRRVVECRLATLFLAKALDFPDWIDLLQSPLTCGLLLRAANCSPATATDMIPSVVPEIIEDAQHFAALLGITTSAFQKAAILEAGGQTAPFPHDGFKPRKRIAHVLQEAVRVGKATHAFQNDQLEEAGQAMTESYRSARDLYQISTPALDDLINSGLKAGALGGRIAGAGFGGCAVFLLRHGQFPGWKEQVARAAPKAGPFWQARPSPSASINRN